MDILLAIVATIVAASAVVLITALAIGDKTPAVIAGFILLVSGITLVPVSIGAWNANGERLAAERAACTEAGNLWAHDEEACITPDGWTVNVR